MYVSDGDMFKSTHLEHFFVVDRAQLLFYPPLLLIVPFLMKYLSYWQACCQVVPVQMCWTQAADVVGEGGLAVGDPSVAAAALHWYLWVTLDESVCEKAM